MFGIDNMTPCLTYPTVNFRFTRACQPEQMDAVTFQQTDINKLKSSAGNRQVYLPASSMSDLFMHSS